MYCLSVNINRKKVGLFSDNQHETPRFYLTTFPNFVPCSNKKIVLKKKRLSAKYTISKLWNERERERERESKVWLHAKVNVLGLERYIFT